MMSPLMIVVVFVLLINKIQSKVEVSGALRKDTVWKEAESPYHVTDTLGIPTDVTLTIEAGVQIMFDGDFEILVREGTLKVLGTVAKPVIFTSTSSGSNWMVTFKMCDLSQSLIISAMFFGPRPAVQLADSRESSVQNRRELLLQYCFFLNGSKVAHNSGDVAMLDISDPPIKSSLCLLNVSIFNSSIQSAFGWKGRYRIVNSYIVNSTVFATGSNEGIQLESCYIQNTTIRSFDGYSSTVSIDNSTLYNVDIPYGDTAIRMRLFIRRSLFYNGSITGGVQGTDIRIESSTLIYVNMRGGGSGEQSFHPQMYFALLLSTFRHGLLSLSNYQVDLISSDIVLAQSPLKVGGNSTIQCTSITCVEKTDQNTTGIEVDDVKIKKSSIYNFHIGIRAFKSCKISASNVYNNQLYNIENHGAYDIPATGNWWGTTNEKEIDDKLYDFYDDLNRGRIIHSDFSMTMIKNNNEDCAKEYIATHPRPYSNTNRLVCDTHLAALLLVIATFLFH